MAGLVVLEGIDGCGKSSVAKRLANAVGSRAVLTREPTDSWIGRAVKRGEKGKVSPYTDALLFMADRAKHTQQMRDWIAKGKLVVCDRYYHSTVAYQAAYLKEVFEGDPFKWLLESNLRISIRPDLTVLLTIPPEVGLERISGRKRLSRFEKLDFLKEVHRNYLRLARVDKSIVKVDANRPLDTVTAEVIELVRRRKL
jgi:dTMP kinase